MKHRSIERRSIERRLVTVIAGLALAAPLWGGTVYVPLVLDLELNGHRLTTEVRVTNNSDEPRELTYLYLVGRSDGTVPKRAEQNIRLMLSPRETEVLTGFPASGAVRGVLEITADLEISISSRVVSFLPDGSPGPAVEIPVLTSENLSPGGSTAMLQGWRREGTQKTDFYVLNLDHEAASCQIAVYRRSGVLVTEQAVPVKPLSLQYFQDVLILLGEVSRDNVSATVTCDRRFHAFAVTVDPATANLVHIVPSGSGSSMLAPPDQVEPPPLPAVACPAGAVFRRDNAFHRPTRGKETRRFEIPMASGQLFTRLEVDVDFTPGDWSNPPDGNHAVLWLNRTERWASNVFGYVNVFGPNKNFAKISTNAGLAPGADLRAFKSSDVDFEKGVTYHVHYVYDTSLDLMEAVFTVNTGTPAEQEVARATGTTTVNVIRTQDPGFFVFFGHPAQTAGPEVPTYGWLYSNLCIQLQ